MIFFAPRSPPCIFLPSAFLVVVVVVAVVAFFLASSDKQTYRNVPRFGCENQMDYDKISGFFPMEWIMSGDFGWGFNKKKNRLAAEAKKAEADSGAQG